MHPILLDRRHAFWWFAAYLAFVVYGSLIPFETRGYTFETAVDAFAAIPYLSLGVASRADWVANILLYLPLAFLGCTWIGGGLRAPTTRLAAVALVVAICLAVATAVEFTQVFFAPRTVSLNDLLAETLGTLGGVAVWVLWRHRLAALLDAFTQGGRQSVLAAIAMYALAYLALAMFPYDFLVSADEFAWKLSSDHVGWIFAGDCASWLRCAASQTGEVLAIAPLGVLFALAAPRPLSVRRLFAAGALLGLLLELAQLLLGSGVSQGLSLVWRGAGLVAGAALGQALKQMGPRPVARFIWLAVLLGAIPYSVAVAAASGWFSRPWIASDAALARLAEIRFLPFYYHYFTTETHAMASLLAQAAMYGPVGLATWAYLVAGHRTVTRGWAVAGLAGAAAALPIELGKLWVPPKHPDFTDLLLAAVSAAFVYALMRWIESVLGGGGTNVADRAPKTRATAATLTSKTAQPLPRGAPASAVAVMLVLLGLWNYPVAAPLLAIVLTAYAALLYRYPTAWLLAVPALLPTLDLSPFTGALLLDEFDLVVLVSLALGYWRYLHAAPRPWPNRLLPIALGLLLASWGTATALGSWPALNSETDFFAPSSHSPLQAWMVGKGVLWALLSVPLLRRIPADRLVQARQFVLVGLSTGLMMVVAVVFWERHVFVGIADFENVFRVTGTFSNMNTGGAYIEAFIALAFPALLTLVLFQPKPSWRVVGLLLVPATSYAMFVTFSRGGYAGLVVGLVIVALGFAKRRGHRRLPALLALGGTTLAVLVAAMPILSGGFAQYRLARAYDDLSVRISHWSNALDLMHGNLLAHLAGNGFGRYPTLYLYGIEASRAPGTYSILHEEGNPYLRLGAGESVFLDQWIHIKPDTTYKISAKIRSPLGEAALSIALCEKALLYSFECVHAQLRPPQTNAWSNLAEEISVGQLSNGGHWPHRPVKLSLYNGSGSHVVDVDEVRLTGGDGRNLIVNGDFHAGISQWLFVTDQDLAWHIHQQEVETYFAQGLLGLLALAALLFGVANPARTGLKAGDPFAIALTGGLAGFLAVGLLGSTVDAARSAMLFYFTVSALGLLTSRNTVRRDYP